MSTALFLSMVFLMLAMLAVEMCWIRHQQKKARKHDQVLFPFCQLRRDIMGFLHENAFETPAALPREEYDSIRRLLAVLDRSIHNYNSHKTVMFNIRKMAKYLEQYRHTVKQAQPIDLTNNPEIWKFHARFIQCFAKAFLAYTPLIRSELALQLVAHAYRASKKASAQRIAKYVVSNAERVRNDARHDGFIANAMA